MRHYGLKWTRTKIIYPTDHIISSRAREIGDFGFDPEYNKVQHTSMRFLMSNEYMRLWFKERDAYLKESFAKQQRSVTDFSIKRAFVQKMFVDKSSKTRHLPIITLKKFQNVDSKIDNKRTAGEKSVEEKKQPLGSLRVERYKPNCGNQKIQKKIKVETEGQKKDQEAFNPPDKVTAHLNGLGSFEIKRQVFPKKEADVIQNGLGPCVYQMSKKLVQKETPPVTQLNCSCSI